MGGAEQPFFASSFAASVKPEEYFGPQDMHIISTVVKALQEHKDSIGNIINALSYRFRVPLGASDQQREAMLHASTDFFKALSLALAKELTSKAPTEIQDTTHGAATEVGGG